MEVEAYYSLGRKIEYFVGQVDDIVPADVCAFVKKLPVLYTGRTALMKGDIRLALINIKFFNDKGEG